jgi:hypothetical protein
MRLRIPPLLLAFPLVVVPLALGACGNTYHPEYHPVTVTQLEQQIAYPVTVQTGTEPAPVVVAPAPPAEPPAPWPPWPSR